MELARKLELIDKQISDANGGFPEDFEAWRNRTEVVVRTIFGDPSVILGKFNEVSYFPGVWWEGMDTSGYQPAGVNEVVAILNAAKLELEIGAETIAPAEPTTTVLPSTRVFIVHGRDDARKFELASFLQNLTGEQPVILHQQANGGQVLIEKLEEHAGRAGFAVVLLTGDDVGRAKELDAADARPRARQNVILEMGFFFGLIGRQRVAVLYESNVELPSDISGLVYTEVDAAGGWKPKLAAELDRAGIKVDWAKLAQG
ncbi:hypothetical protein DEA06_15335 [Microbacterium sp. Gd 4-13]|uniref:TIR domain-containing protein n=1 Tax=Microbacterium sp. Gd 4-13 TaxID=2173179 RepID=UPI000D57DB73|nr:nucleotide-binding protein [Microbacterium sp. Gd 4-13]PVW02517.1 hypothetical protein DEA06_15335 [Microbacterium sp. Gd 4-13]